MQESVLILIKYIGFQALISYLLSEKYSLALGYNQNKYRKSNSPLIAHTPIP